MSYRGSFSSLAGEALTAAECASLLEDAQCQGSDEATSALRTVVRSLQGPHPSITSSALDLLVIHPAETIPFIPDLISAHPEEISRALDVFGDLLSADRALLLPIIGTLSEMPLSPTQALDARRTLLYALHTVDEQDLPVVVRTLLKTAASNAQARWAVSCIRSALSTTSVLNNGNIFSSSTSSPSVNLKNVSSSPSSSTSPSLLLSTLILDAARPQSSPVSRALRRACGTVFATPSPTDVPSWAASHVHAHWNSILRASTMSSGFASTSASLVQSLPEEPALKSAVSRGALTGSSAPLSSARMLLSLSAAVHPGALCLVILQILRVAAMSPTMHPAEGAALAAIARHAGEMSSDIPPLLLARCSAYGAPSSRVHIGVSFALLRKTGLALRRGRNGDNVGGQDDEEECNYRLQVAQAIVDHDAAWNSIFLKMRKALVFGSLAQRMCAISMAEYIARHVSKQSVVNEVLRLLHACVPHSPFTSYLSAPFLQILAAAAIRCVLHADAAATYFESRVEKYMPPSFFSIADEIDRPENQLPRDVLNVDIAKCSRGNNNDNAYTLYALVAAGVALIARQQVPAGTFREIASKAVHVAVRIPVICLPLYNYALESTSSSTEGVEDHEQAVSENELKIARMTEVELQDALTSFVRIISSITAVVNVSCTSLATAWDVLRERSEKEQDETSTNATVKNSQKDLAELLERLVEFIHMRKALAHGLHVYRYGGSGGGVAGMEGANNKKQARDHDSSEPEFEFGEEEEENDVDFVAPKSARERRVPEDMRVLVNSALRANTVVEEQFALPKSQTSSAEECDFEFPQHFPTLSLAATLAAFVAVPDVKEIEDVEKFHRSNPQSDPAMADIQALLLKRLICIIQGPRLAPCSSPGEKEDIDATGSDGKALVKDHGLLGLDENGDEDIEVASEEELVAPLLDEHGNVTDMFYGEPTDSEPEDEGKSEIQSSKNKKSKVAEAVSGTSAVKWVTPMPLSAEDLYLETCFDCSAAGNYSENTEAIARPTTFLYTPQLLALLLDRAVTYTTVASCARRTLSYGNAHDLEFVKSSNSVVGMSLCVCVHILQHASVLDSWRRASTASSCSLEQESDSASIMRSFIANTDACLKTLAPKGKLVCSDETEYRVINALEWISKISIDVASATLALDTLSLLSEFGIVHAGLFREFASAALHRVHEYDNNTLWACNDFDVLFTRRSQNWIVRRRHAGCGPIAKEDVAYRIGPWILIADSATSQNMFLQRYRLRVLFNGMYLEDAAREACAWIELFSKRVTTGGKKRGRDRDAVGVGESILSAVIDSSTLLDFLSGTVVLSGLLQVRTLSEEASSLLCMGTLSQSLWLTRCVRALAQAFLQENIVRMDHKRASTVSTLLQHARYITEAFTTEFNSPATNVPELDTGVVRTLAQISHALSEASADAMAIVADLKRKTLLTESNGTRGNEAVMAQRARKAVPRLQLHAEGARRAAKNLKKVLESGISGKKKGSGKMEVARVGQGCSAWRYRRSETEACEEFMDEEEEEDSDGSMVEELAGFHSTAGRSAGDNAASSTAFGKETVVVSFSSASR